MKKSKLPRKRKKSFIKKYGWGEYYLFCTLNEILYEVKGKAQKFPIYDRNNWIGGKPKLIKNW